MFNDGRWCDSDYIEIDENGVCVEYERDEAKAIEEHNEKLAEIINKVADMNADEKAKDNLTLLLLLGMKTEDGETVFDKLKEQGLILNGKN